MNFKKFSSVAFIVLALFAGIAFFSFDHPEGSGIGTRTFLHLEVNDTSVSSTTLHSSVMSTPVAAGQAVHVHYSLPFNLGGTAPGIQFQVTTPAGSTLYNSAAIIYSNAGSVVAVSDITAAAPQGFTLAVAGNHYATIDFDLKNGATPGSVVLQFAQNVSNASPTILMKGAWADVTKF
jgi:hypothetical protein